MDDAAFLDCVRASLPYAWDVIAGLVTELETGSGEFADNQVPPPDEAARGQLLRLMASDAMRAAVERRYGVRLAFQNCHRAAVFRPAADRRARRVHLRPRAASQPEPGVRRLLTAIYRPNGRWRLPARHRPFRDGAAR